MRRIELVVATGNRKKLEEIKEILKGLNLKISSLEDYPGAPKIIENGRTFCANAVKKATKIAHFTKRLTLGEDSGLCVAALGGLPGVYSARFAGKPACRMSGNASDLQNNLKLLRSLRGLPFPKRKAYYACAVALADAGGLIGVTEGRCRGLIGFEFKGSQGFGYDPLFIIPKRKKTFAELGPRIKHKMSHRYLALLKIRHLLEKYIERSQGA